MSWLEHKFNMVSDTPDQNPFAPVADPASAMDDNPVLSPRSSVDGAAGVLDAAPLQQAAPVAPPAVQQIGLLVALARACTSTWYRSQEVSSSRPGWRN